MIRVLLLAALAVGPWVGPTSATDLIIDPGFTFYTANGEAEFFSTPAIFCFDQGVGPMTSFYVLLYKPETTEPYAACWATAMRANLILERESAVTLLTIGSSVTIPVQLARLQFPDGFILRSCDTHSTWHVAAQLSQARTSSCSMTIRRESEFGGTFDLNCTVYMAYTFQYMEFPWESLGATLGPEVLQATNVSWSTLSIPGGSGRVTCPSCSGNFFVGGTRLSGIGNSQGDESHALIRLQDSRMDLQLTPACASPIAVHDDNWAHVKALYRDATR